MRAHRLSLLGLLACTAAPPPGPAQVRPGIDIVLTDSVHLIRGKRLGLLTNQTGVDRQGRRDVDVLMADGYRLMALFSPEHGFRGLEDRQSLPDATDSASGLPIYSLYGVTPLSRRAVLDSVDVLLVDLQDIGARYYTYYSSATQLVREAARRGKPVVVLDRPNPIGGDLVQGNVRASPSDPDSDFVGFLAIPMRHGLTLGELLRVANDQLGLHADLKVVPARGWRRAAYFDATGLPWVRPSPNMPSLESALHYPGICLFEGTNLSVGRGTPIAYQFIGAPWLDAHAVLAQVARERLPGVELSAADLTPQHPTDRKYDGVLVHGITLSARDRDVYDPTHVAVALLAAIRAAHPDSFRFNPRSFDRLAAGPELRAALEAQRGPAEIWRAWDAGLARFRATRDKYLVY